MSVTVTRTKHTRYRLLERWFGKSVFVLQVMDHHKGFYVDRDGDCIDVDKEVWRDATAEDMRINDLL